MQDDDLNKSLKSTERNRSGMSDEINTNVKVKDKIKPRLFFKLKKKEYKIRVLFLLVAMLENE